MRNLMTRSWLLLTLFVMLGVTACDEDQDRANNVSTNPAVEAKAAKLLSAIQRGDDEQIIKQYDEQFFASHDPQEWLAKLKSIMAERGPMKSFRLRRSQADTRFSGEFYILEYESVHNGNKRLHHLITVILPVKGGGIELIGHKITPWEATDEVDEKSNEKSNDK